ncbi:hydrolase TatD [Megasphaera cerevisiae DSM 20462]|uniref:Hydrolase TatD n=1 Tax=Megasphaera cerevisiae DSM 20462 TaxID=1122219 RepID=A0A0J6WZ95_9FIRM|nr:TatD family hydrolase [Megasphaera cerevisiae]KMO87558.1 hydrolase TatD [Megasphaera cerevisiae DSM 20462]SJZ53845.1 TatD DNase family protein [Megasphaera cerevisiae DSM 20462]
MLFDTHCHVNDEAYTEDRDAMLQRAIDAGVQYMMCPGTDVQTSAEAIALSHQYPQIYAAVGIHPEDAALATTAGLAQLRQWLQTEDKVVAIGEVGLDYHWPEPSHEIQQDVFIEQVKMAVELDMPIDIHDREAHGDTMDILRQYGKGIRGVFHCYSGSLEMAQELIKMGFYIGFTGTMVFPKSTKLKRIVQELPMDRILIETDCPYLTPPPYRGRRNEPSYVQYVAGEIARLRDMDLADVQRITLENGRKIFRITEMRE